MDRLRLQIEHALDGNVASDIFEECAVSLLLSEHPSLVLLPGGSDFGLDGVTTEDPQVGSVGLVATTGRNPLRNLSHNLSRHLEIGGKTRRVIFATPRRINPIQRRHLVERAATLGFRLEQVYERSALTERLYHAPDWRKRLLGLSGAPDALSVYPVSVRIVGASPIVGRDDVMERLRNAQGGISIVGQPGVGKTYLLRALADEGWGLFVVDHDRERLADAIRELSPRRLIVEDAHFNLGGSLEALAQLRSSIKAEFDIVFTTWPGRAGDLQGELTEPSEVRLDLLDRDEILAIIKGVGIFGPTALLRVIVDQACGRAGLAVTLARACLDGRVVDVARGDALMRETVTAYRRLLGNIATSVMSVLALAGDHGATLEEIAMALSLDYPTAQELIRGLAHGGTISDSRNNRLIILPAELRYPLVADGFFGLPGALPLERVLDSLEAPLAAIQPLIGAELRGAPVPRELLERLLGNSRDPKDFAAFAYLGSSEAKYALSIAPTARNEIALAALNSAPATGLRMLLENAVGDDRQRHSHPDHAMRQFENYVTHVDSRLERRRVAMPVIDEWISSGGNADVALEAMSYVLKPGVHGLESDPGSGMNVTISGALLPLPELRVVGELMTRCLEHVRALDPTTYAPFLRVVEDWCYPARVTFSQGAVDPTWYAFARRTAKRCVEQLLVCLSYRIGVRVRLIRLARRCRLRVATRAVDSEYDTLFPSHFGTDWRKQQARQLAAMDTLIESWKTKSPESVVDRILNLENEARLAGDTYESQTHDFCRRLAGQVSAPLVYVEELVRRHASPELVGPFVEAAIRNGAKRAPTVVAALLRDANYRLVGISMCLQFDSMPQKLTERAILSCQADTARLIEILAAREELRDSVIEPLLTHAVGDVSRATAIGIRDRVSPELQATWEATIVRCPADEHWYSVILNRRPRLFGAWLAASAERAQTSPHSYEYIPHTVTESVATMRLTHRIELIKALPTNLRTYSLEKVVTSLVGKDLSAYEALLQRADLKSYYGCGLAGRPDESWFARAELALAHGWSPADTCAAAYYSEDGWTGEESEYLLGWRRSFQGYRKGARGKRRQLIDAASAYFDALRAKAVCAEKIQRIRGLNA